MLVLVATAFAEEPAELERLYDAILGEALDGDVAVAAATYRDLSKNLAPSRTRDETLYWLGRAELSLGHVDLARAVLKEGARVDTVKRPCLDVLGQIELGRLAVSNLPLVWDFSDETHGFFHPWSDPGSIRVLTDPMPHLAWSTGLDTGTFDRLVVGLDHPEPTPKIVRLTADSEPSPAQVRLLVYDDAGWPFATADLLDLGAARTFEIRLDELVPLAPGAPALDPTRAERIVLEDHTGSGGQTTENVVRIRRFSIE